MSECQNNLVETNQTAAVKSNADCFLEQFADETKKSGGNFFIHPSMIGKCEESFDFNSS